MRILCKKEFQDYYDYLSHTLGSDPEIVLLRNKIEKTYFENISLPIRLDDTDKYKKTTYEYFYIVAGQFCFLIEIINKYKWINKEYVLQEKTKKVVSDSNVTTLRWNKKTFSYEKLQYTVPSHIIHKLLKALKIPVFSLHRSGPNVVVTGLYPPILKDYGIDKLVEAKDMWQNIYHVMTNIIRESPDTKIPLELTNSEKIIAAGFDMKTSFRNNK